MKKLRGVCIGAGYFSHFHFEAWCRIPEVEIVAVCDLKADQAKSTAEQYQIKTYYTQVEEMLLKEQPDFIDIITPPATHLEICRLATQYGVSIICQKPLAPTIKEALAIQQLVQKSGVFFAVHENWRFQPWYRKINTLIQHGSIGEKIFNLSFRMRMGDGWHKNAYQIRQPYFREMKRFLIHETGVHFIDTFRFLLGDVTKVHALTKQLNPAIKGEDFALIVFTFENGSTAIFEGNRYNEPNYPKPRYTFGEMVLDGNRGSLRLYGDGTIGLQLLGDCEKKIEYDHKDQGFCGDSVYAFQSHVADCLIKGLKPETCISEYISNVIIEEAIYTSAEEEKTQTIILPKTLVS